MYVKENKTIYLELIELSKHNAEKRSCVRATKEVLAEKACKATAEYLRPMIGAVLAQGESLVTANTVTIMQPLS